MKQFGGQRPPLHLLFVSLVSIRVNSWLRAYLISYCSFLRIWYASRRVSPTALLSLKQLSCADECAATCDPVAQN